LDIHIDSYSEVIFMTLTMLPVTFESEKKHEEMAVISDINIIFFIRLAFVFMISPSIF